MNFTIWAAEPRKSALRFPSLSTYLFIFSLLLCRVEATELTSWPYWRTSMIHTSWSSRDGAPSENFSIAQDDRGMLWFASPDGLRRFDGVHFEQLTAIDGNELRSVQISAILPVGSALWVSYSFGGVSVFEQGRVRHYGLKEGLPEQRVYRLARGGNGILWAGTSRSLYKLDGQRWRMVGAGEGLPAGDCRNFHSLSDGSILVSIADGLYRSNSDGSRFSRVPLPMNLKWVQKMTDGNEFLLMRDESGRYFRYSAVKNILRQIPLSPTDKVISGFIDRREAVWINTDSGLKLLDKNNRVMKVFSAPIDLSSRIIHISFDDREGNLWLTTANGVDRFRESRLNPVPFPSSAAVRLNLQVGSDGVIWIGHDNYSNYTGDIDLPSMGLQRNGKLVNGQGFKATSSTRDPDGSVWLGDQKALRNVANGHWREWPLPPDLRDNEVQAMAMDRQSRLWVSIARKRVYLFHDGQWEAYGGLKELESGPAVSLYIDPRERVWFGYPSNRLAVLDAGRVQKFTAENGLHVGSVTAVASLNDRIFVGGAQGVAAFDNGRFIELLDLEGRPLGGISSMIATSGGELWLHARDGLIRIDSVAMGAIKKNGYRVRIERFDYLDGHDGPPDSIRPLSTLLEADDGKLWYAALGSIGWIDPRHIVRNKLAPTPQVMALRSNKKSYRILENIILPKNTHDLEIDYTAAALSIPERVRFRFRLVGLERSWHEATSRRTAFYTNLDHGDYRFEVMAANEDGVWSAAPASLGFRIEPAFTQTIWFKLLCASIILASAAALYWWRVNRLTRIIADRLRERVLERERIARTLHDSFLQSVQALMMQFHLIKHTLPESDPAQEKINAALNTADDVLTEGREQVLALRLNHELSGDLENALSGLGHILAPRHKSSFALKVRGIPRPLRAMAAAEAYAIAREAMLNAFRHSQSDEVSVLLDHGKAQFSLQVSDLGRGMSAEIYARGQRPGHWGLTGMRERAHDAGGILEIVSEEGRGTKITLRLPERSAYARKDAD